MIKGAPPQGLRPESSNAQIDYWNTYCKCNTQSYVDYVPFWEETIPNSLETRIMLTTTELLDLLQIHAAELGKNPTDYAVAKLLKADHQTIYNWRKGKTVMSYKYALKVSSLLSLPTTYVMACLTAESNKETDLYPIFCDMAKRLSPSKQDYQVAA